MTDNEIIKAWEKVLATGDAPIGEHWGCSVSTKLAKETFDMLNRLKAENDDLFYKLEGVMHSVDKWLEGDELKQDEVNRAITMREKTLQITEKQQAEIEKLTEERDFYKAPSSLLAKGIEQIKSEAIKEFAERLKQKYDKPLFYLGSYEQFMRKVDNLVKEMTEQSTMSQVK